MRRFSGILILIAISFHAGAQENLRILPVNPLSLLLDSIHRVKDDSVRLMLNTEFYEKLKGYAEENILTGGIPDSLRISNVVSEDGIVRILSWNIQQNSGENIYSGLIIHSLLKSVIPLKMKKSEPALIDGKIYNDGDWPAGIIYRIIQRRFNKKTNYTLLTWDGFDKRITRKSIESLSFDDQGKAVFGAPVFKIKEGIRNRIVNEYSSSASFSMQYNRQKVILSGVRKSLRNIDDDMIVLDRLIPLNEDLKGQRWAYVPAGNTYDAFIYFEGFWTLTEDIAARNKPSGKGESKRTKNTELDLLPPENK
ncbi:MAG: hypothetical protein IPN08_19300 [Bacteroidales bacterium]|nr:hypothetical protein [Bacteroidales bacterium]MBK9359487.1 hypothetical protein [Bacteroidales bacterium]